MDSVKQYLRWRQIPRDLSVRVRRYYEHFYEQRSVWDELSILRGLNSALHGEVVGQVLQRTLGQLPLFRRLSVDFQARMQRERGARAARVRPDTCALRALQSTLSEHCQSTRVRAHCQSTHDRFSPRATLTYGRRYPTGMSPTGMPHCVVRRWLSSLCSSPSTSSRPRSSFARGPSPISSSSCSMGCVLVLPTCHCPPVIAHPSLPIRHCPPVVLAHPSCQTSEGQPTLAQPTLVRI